MTPLRVSSRSDPNAVAGAVAGAVRRGGGTVVQVVGAGALNQAVKAIAIARSHVAPNGIDLVCIPRFVEIKVGPDVRTAIQLAVVDRRAESRAGEPPVIDLREPQDLPTPVASPPWRS